MQRSSDTLRALAELDAAELKRHRQNALMWQAMLTYPPPPIPLNLLRPVSQTVPAITITRNKAKRFYLQCRSFHVSMSKV